METAKHIVLIGGSAGSFGIITDILETLPPVIDYALCIVIHRNKNYNTHIEKSLAAKLGRKVVSVIDKMSIQNNTIYFAPPGYHLLIEPNYTFSLDSSDPVNFSRPSIDILFETCAQVYGKNCHAFLLSGANEDGARGLHFIEKFAGKIFIQNPKEAIIDIMPSSAIKNTIQGTILSNKNIIEYFRASKAHYE